jgi:Rne/Rng family ribonuclease
MAKSLLIDAAQSEEVRVAVVNNKKIDLYESELYGQKQTRGNIYLGRVVHIEPALNAAFVDYGQKRHGFLPLSEVQPYYYDHHSTAHYDDHKKNHKSYIPPSLKKNQLVLVEITKQERGSKGAALTTQISLAGRYCVLLHSDGKKNADTIGISRKIQFADDRRRLKEIMSSFQMPEGFSLIARTAGQQQSSIEIEKDYEFLLRLWSIIQEKGSKQEKIGLLFEENNLIKRSIRDIYTYDMDHIWISGQKAYEDAREIMALMLPDELDKLRYFDENQGSLFEEFHIENELSNLLMPQVQLSSGGNIVITSTEAMVTIDVNSSKSNHDRNLHQTVLRTNLEAAVEAAKQIRLRNLGGLIVIDFIDMNHSSDVHLIEEAFKEALKVDRARTQVGKISEFGLLEMTRQRKNLSLAEVHTKPCEHCLGRGFVYTPESLLAQILRQAKRLISHSSQEKIHHKIIIYTAKGLDFYLLNEKRIQLLDLEHTIGCHVVVMCDFDLKGDDFRIVLETEESHSTSSGDSFINHHEREMLHPLRSLYLVPQYKNKNISEEQENYHSQFKKHHRRQESFKDHQPTSFHEEEHHTHSPNHHIKKTSSDEPIQDSYHYRLEKSQSSKDHFKKKNKKSFKHLSNDHHTNIIDLPIDELVEIEKKTDLTIVNTEDKINKDETISQSNKSLFQHFIYYKGNKKREFSKKAKTKETYLTSSNHKDFLVQHEDLEKKALVESSFDKESLVTEFNNEKSDKKKYINQGLSEPKDIEKKTIKRNKKSPSDQQKKTDFSSNTIKNNKDDGSHEKEPNLKENVDFPQKRFDVDFESVVLKKPLEEKINPTSLNSNPMKNDPAKDDKNVIDPLLQKKISTQRNKTKSFRKNSVNPKKQTPNNEDS